ncbi:MAG TPA: hypothetical protein VKB70_00425 [Gaiellaceae bacterium]|nr:hypothetical protein [Gaiellaceae bacterium]
MRFDWKQLSTQDRVIAGGAAIAFIALFLPWYGVSVGPFSASVNGWSAGFTAWAGAVLLTVAGALLVMRRSRGALPSLQVGPAVLVAGIAALGLLLVIIRWVSLPRYNLSAISYNAGARYGLYIALIAGIAEVAAAVMQMRESGEKMPWAPADHATAPPPEEPPPAPPAAEE